MGSPQPSGVLSRATVLQGLLSLHDDPAYLEVGVSKGVTFHALQASKKVAVDPRFQFVVADAAAENPNATYHEVPSDEYFGKLGSPHDRFDVIYLDGLHTFEQTLRDLLNAILILKPNGVIVIDDIYPSSLSASLRSQTDAQTIRKKIGAKRKQWMGDVYRLAFFVETFMQQITFRTVKENHGQLVLWQERREKVPERKFTELGYFGYEQVILQEEVFRFAPYDVIRADYAKARGLDLPKIS